jgi:hypothetical protein
VTSVVFTGRGGAAGGASFEQPLSVTRRDIMRSRQTTNTYRWLERGKRESTLVLLQSISVRDIPEASVD